MASGHAEEITVHTFENQRYYVWSKWSDKLLPTDRPHWSDERGTRRSDREDFTLPSEDWEWKTQWRVDHTDADEEGWRYALDFSSSHWGPSDTLKYVRRRKWYRVMRHKQQPAAAGAPELAVDDEKTRPEELRRHVSDILRKYDRNGDGALTREDIAQLIRDGVLAVPSPQPQLPQPAAPAAAPAESRQLVAPPPPPPLIRKRSEDDKCRICLERDINCCMVPCGHLSVCTECANTVVAKQPNKPCPICRVTVTSFLKVFKS